MRLKFVRMGFLFAYVVLACGVVLAVRPYYFFSIVLVLGVPTAINFYWLRASRWKVLVFALVTTIIFAPPLELAARLADVWDVQSIFPRPFGLIPLENMLFAFINFFWGLSFYEYFVDGDKRRDLSLRFRYLVLLYMLMATVVYALYFIDPSLVRLNYFVLAVPAVIVPAVLIFSKKPSLIKKTVVPTIFFALVFFIYEMVSLQVGSWWWPGEYAFALNVGGKTFPLDDVVIWYLLATPALIGGYEFFADDWK